MMRRPALLPLAALLFALPAAADQAGEGAVDLALVLLVDGSASISDGALRFQLEGHEAAFRRPEVAAAIASGGLGAISVTLAAYAGPGQVEVLVPWTRIASEAESVGFADAIAAAEAPPPAGSTALGSALLGGAALFADGPEEPLRRRIDLVGNGFSNAGIEPASARDFALIDGITISALAITDDYPWLADYYTEQVIGGPGAFAREASSDESFAEAILAKLVLEIVGDPQPRPSQGEPVRLARAEAGLPGQDRLR